MSHEAVTAAIDALGGLDAAIATPATATPSSPTEGSQSAAPAPAQAPAQAPVESTTTVPPLYRDQAGRFSPKPDTPVTNQEAPPQATPATSAATEETPFTDLDPTTLPPELQGTYRSMQAEFTRKTQAIAEQRKQYESYGDPDQVKNAMELYEQLQDPTAWQALHSELTAGLQAIGWSPQAAAAEADRQITEAVEPAEPALLDFDDPDLAPIKAHFDSMKSEIQAMKDGLAAQQQAAERRNWEMAVLGEMQRQEGVLRQANPHYDQTDIDAIHELSSFYDGNLLDASRRYEDIIGSRIARYFDMKQQLPAVNPLPGGAVQTTTPVTFRPGEDGFDDALKAALAASEQLDWDGGQ